MEIQLEHDGKKGAFSIEENKVRLAVMEFTMAGTKRLIIDHTEVGESLRGKGVGLQLLDKLLEYVRSGKSHSDSVLPFRKISFRKRRKYPGCADVGAFYSLFSQG